MVTEQIPSPAGGATSPRVPTSLRRVADARRQHGELADTYFDAMWVGDPLADSFVADFTRLGHGTAMRMLRTACREGIEAVADPPDSLRALFAQLDDTPEWLDIAAIESATRFTARYTLQSGIVLGAASLVSGYANSAASRPLELTGRYIENAGARTIEVGAWLSAVSGPGGLDRHGEGFELTVRVRVIHALVRASLRSDERWDESAWGVPICQAYLAYTLVEFTLIPLRAMSRIGATYLPHEQDAAYARWRYLGHLLGIDASLLPRNAEEQERLEHIYLLTRPVVDDYCRSLVASINREFLVPEIEGVLPAPLRRLAPSVVEGLERLFMGEEIGDELQIPRTPLTGIIAVLGPILGLVNGTLDRFPSTFARRTAKGEAYAEQQEERLRRDWGVQHDLVDASPSGGRPHPARGD